MPIIHENSRAIRVIKGNVSGTQGTDAFGYVTNKEFIRVYKGADLKFDKMLENWFCLINETATDATLAFKKTGTTWTSDVVIKWISSSALTTENTMTLAAATEYTGTTSGSTNVITIPSHGRVYIKNGNISQDFFSQNSSNYITIYASQNFHAAGNWLKLTPRTETSGAFHPYAFYNLFNGCTKLKGVPDLTRTVDGELVRVHQHTFDKMFYGCTGLTKSPAISVSITGGYTDGMGLDDYYEDGTYGYGGQFANMFYGCTYITSCGDIYLDILGDSVLGTRTNDSSANGTMYQMFYGCQRIVTGPKFDFSQPISAVQDYCLRSTFYNCRRMTSLGGLRLGNENGVLRLGAYSMYYTFYNCLVWTGDGLTLTGIHDHEITDSGYQSLVLVSRYSLYRAFCGCKLMTKIFGRCQSVSLNSRDRSYLIFAVTEEGSNTSGHGYNFSGIFYDCYAINDDSIRYTYFGAAQGRKYWSQYDFYQMFYNCTGITDAREIFTYPKYSVIAVENGLNTPSTFAQSILTFSSAFYGCTALQYAALPETVVGSSQIYNSTFYNCTSLIAVTGSTPSTSVYRMCYMMFYNCTSLEIAPIISAATSAGQEPYRQMFYNCSSLKYIVTNINTLSGGTNPFVDWTYGTTDGTQAVPRYFIALNANSAYTTSDWNASGNTTTPNKIPYGWTIIDKPICFQALNQATIRLNKVGNPSGTHVFTVFNLSAATPTQYTYTVGSLLTVANGGICLLWGTSTSLGLSTDENNYFQFSITGSCSVSGNLASLHKHTGLVSGSKDWSYYRLFRECSGLYSASRLTGLSDSSSCCSAWREMLYGCTNLWSAPAPAQTASSAEYAFREMLANCTSLLDPPSLSACTSASKGVLYGIFSGCTSLRVTAALPSSSNAYLGEEKYCRAYAGCTSLNTIPSGYLPWTTVKEKCYYEMFADCTSLASVPDDLLPATNLSNNDDCYNGMFKNCTSLAKGPDLMATTVGSGRPYGAIFYGCTSMTEIKVGFSAWSNAWGTTTYRNTQNWTYGLPADGHFYGPAGITTGTVYKNNSGNTSNSVSGSGSSDTSACYIPYNWTLHNTGGQQQQADWSNTAGMLIFTISSGTVTLSPGTVDSGYLKYTTDGGSTWTTLSSAVTIDSTITKVGIKHTSGIVTGLQQGQSLFTLTGSGKVNVSGNASAVCKLLGNEQLISDASFLFAGCQCISDCTDMYMSSDYIRCFHMFDGSSVTKVKRDLLILHKTTWNSTANFYGMFTNCTSLQIGPHPYYSEPAKKEDFAYMFYGCTSLRSEFNNSTYTPIKINDPAPYGAANRLNDVTYINGGHGETGYISRAYYNAFKGCTSIETIVINIDYLGKSVSNNNLTGTFRQCFDGCTSLTSIYSRQRRWPAFYCTKDWVRGVPEPTGSNTRTFYHFTGLGENLTEYHGDDKVPKGWNFIGTTNWPQV